MPTTPVVDPEGNVTDTFYPGKAFIGYGSQLLVGDGASPEVFEAIADVKEITPGDMTTGVVEKTHLRSPERHREKLATIRDSGPFACKVNYRPTHESHSNAGGGTGAFENGGLMALWRTVKEANFIIRTPDDIGVDIPFRGVVTKCQVGGFVLDQPVDLSVEITPLSDFSAALP
jgi:tail tube protein